MVKGTERMKEAGLIDFINKKKNWSDQNARYKTS